MVITAVSLWIVVAILIIFDSKAESTKWAGLSAFLCSLNGFLIIWENVLYPLVLPISGMPVPLTTNLPLLTAVFISVSIFFSPYAMLMFGISYSNILGDKRKLHVYTLALLPPLLSFIIFLTQLRQFSTRFDLIIHLRVMSYWSIPYVLICVALLLLAILREKSSILKKERLLVGIIAIPLILLSLYINHFAPETDKMDVLRYNLWILSIHFMGYLYFAIRFAFNNKNNQDAIYKAFNSGLYFVNHTVKNDISKLSICLDNIKNSLSKNPCEIECIRANTEVASRSTNHLMAVIKRVQINSSKISLSEESVRFSSVINRVLTASEQSLREKQIQVNTNYDYDPCLLCDPNLLTDAFINIFNNSLEAMDIGGKLSLNVIKFKKGVLVSLSDNGCGISKENMRRVGEPFFSTKNNSSNFGLGLYFAISVFRKHDGTLKIQGNEGGGTTVCVFFSGKRIVNSCNVVFVGEGA